jgi:hypothetical protein
LDYKTKYNILKEQYGGNIKTEFDIYVVEDLSNEFLCYNILNLYNSYLEILNEICSKIKFKITRL